MELKDIKCTQDAFDFIVSNVIAQGRGSFIAEDGDSGITCRYRDRQGNKCAVGWLIPDHEYNAGYEGESGYPVLLACSFWQQKMYPFVRPEFSNFSAMVCSLQMSHDQACADRDFLQVFIKRARENAKTLNIEWKFGDV